MKLLYIFDMGGVIVSDHRVIPKALEYLGIGLDEFFDYAGSGIKELQAGKISGEDFWTRFSSGYGRPVEEDLWTSFFRPKLIPEMIDLVLELKREHRVVCGTNTMDAHYDFHNDRGDYRYFHALYASNKIGLVKPDTDFFRHILEQEGYAPESAVFIDDLEENVRAVGSLGIKGLFFEDTRSLRLHLAELGLWANICKPSKDGK